MDNLDPFDVLDYAIEVLSGRQVPTLATLFKTYDEISSTPSPDPSDRPRQTVRPVLNKNSPAYIALSQQCLELCDRLSRIRSFAPFFTLSRLYQVRRPSTDPVTRIWDLVSLGAPLCFIYNLLPLSDSPTRQAIEIDTDPDGFDYRSSDAKRRAIALFAKRVRKLDKCVAFNVNDLRNRDSVDGLIKVSNYSQPWNRSLELSCQVIRNVSIIVDQLPESVFEPNLVSESSIASEQATTDVEPPLAVSGSPWDLVVVACVSNEQKYIRGLETMQVSLRAE